MSPALKPRLTCRVVRMWSEIAGNAENAAARSAHVRNCPDCQAFYRGSDQLVHTLRHTPAASATTAGFSDDLARRIALSVREATPVARPQRKVRSFGYATALGVAAALLMTLAVIRRDDGQSHAGATVAANGTAATRNNAVDVADLVANVDTMSQKLLASVQPSATRLATENPLSRELDNVQADARSAIGYLALNFFPNGEVPFARSRTDNT